MTIRNIKAMFAVFLLVLLVCFGAVMGGQGNLSAFAATDVQTAYENTNVLDNLEGSTIGGKEFDIADYPHSDSGVPQVISLVEFCYSYYADRRSDFGLYVYVYNPQDIAFDMATDRNKIQLTYGDKQSYSKYTLEFLNYSERAGYEDYYNGFMELVGKESPETDYAFHTNEKGGYLGGFYFVNYSHGYNYSNSVDDVLTKLNYVFYAENGDADTYTLPAEELLGNSKSGKKGWFETYTQNFGGELVNDKYSAALFESVDSQFTDTTITSDDTFNLTSVTTSQNLWQKIWGTSTSYTNTYTMSAIQDVTLDAMDNALSEKQFCNEYFVAEGDYDELYSYVKTAKARDETVYLFRYYQSEYFAVELSEGIYETGFYTEMVGDMSMPMYGRHYEHKDTNAYLCQMWVQLDFDIIDLTFTKNNVDTVIPVIMSPMDIAADGTPPLVTTKDGLAWWQILLAVLALVLVVILLFKFAPVLVLAVGTVIALPFKAISAAGKSLKERRQEKKAQKQGKKPPDDADDTEV